MIYFTTFILTLLFSHIARATPACADVTSETSPKELYDLYADAQHALPIVVYDVTWTNKYGNPNGSTNCVACSNLAHRFPHFRNFTSFPYIGGAFNIKRGSPNCGECWTLTNLRTHKSISFTAIDSATTGFNISKESFIVLNGGTLGNGTLQAEAKLIPRHFCDFK